MSGGKEGHVLHNSCDECYDDIYGCHTTENNDMTSVFGGSTL